MDTALSEIIRFRKQGVSFQKIAAALNAVRPPEPTRFGVEPRVCQGGLPPKPRP